MESLPAALKELRSLLVELPASRFYALVVAALALAGVYLYGK